MQTIIIDILRQRYEFIETFDDAEIIFQIIKNSLSLRVIQHRSTIFYF